MNKIRLSLKKFWKIKVTNITMLYFEAHKFKRVAFPVVSLLLPYIPKKSNLNHLVKQGLIP